MLSCRCDSSHELSRVKQNDCFRRSETNFAHWKHCCLSLRGRCSGLSGSSSHLFEKYFYVPTLGLIKFSSRAISIVSDIEFILSTALSTKIRLRTTWFIRSLIFVLSAALSMNSRAVLGQTRYNPDDAVILCHV